MNALVTFYCLCLLALGAKFIWKSIRLGRRDTDGAREPIVEEPEEPATEEKIVEELLSGDLITDEKFLSLLDDEEPAPVPADDPQDRLDHLKALYEAGILDREEYNRRVKQHRERTEAR